MKDETKVVLFSIVYESIFLKELLLFLIRYFSRDDSPNGFEDASRWIRANLEGRFTDLEDSIDIDPLLFRGDDSYIECLSDSFDNDESIDDDLAVLQERLGYWLLSECLLSIGENDLGVSMVEYLLPEELEVKISSSDVSEVNLVFVKRIIEPT